MLKIEQVHREVRQTFQQNPGPKLIKICDKKVKKVRLNTTDKETSNNMMCVRREVRHEKRQDRIISSRRTNMRSGRKGRRDKLHKETV